MILEKYSFGIGDRFGHQGKAQLRAILRAQVLGINLVPVWNKSFREHQIIGTEPASVLAEAEQAVMDLSYKGPYYVDADHINMGTVDGFVNSSSFFTLDVAKYIGQKEPEDDSRREKYDLLRQKTLDGLKSLGSEVMVAGLDGPILLNDEVLNQFLDMYFLAVQAASELFIHVLEKKGKDNFITEVSMDEVEKPQTPRDLFLILYLLSFMKVPVQTIAPKFSGRFNKGVDYVGNLDQFREEFEADLLVIRHGIKHFGLPANLKLSIHSGSDKFSIYPIMGQLIRKYDMGIHVKTAGTTWLEEVIGLAMSGSESVLFVKDLYKKAKLRKHELCGPYADVIDIDPEKLPDHLDDYSGDEIAGLLRHIPGNKVYSSHVRQLVHVGYKLAAEAGQAYTDLLKKNEEIIGKQVEENIFERHIKRLFVI